MSRWLNILAVCAVLTANAQVDTMTGVTPGFASLQIRVDGDDQALPAIELGGPQTLEIHFDELADDRRYLRYDITHCNADWTPSQLLEAEYLDGFNEGYVDNYEFSRATTVPYVHYRIDIPAQGGALTPTKSGNYLVRIYDESDPDTTLAQARFMVTEQTALLRQAQALTRTDVGYNSTHQQLAFEVDLSHCDVADIYRDLHVVVGQNGRLDNERAVGAPMRVTPGHAYYEHQQPLIFEAGNEYRRFETVSTTYPGMRVDGIEYHGPYYHAWVVADEPRADDSYVFDRTQHGRFRVREYNSTESDTEADYVITHFTLQSPELPGMVFLDGDHVLRRFDDNSLMTYDREAGQYQKSLLLKQGSYNYQYLYVPPGARRGYTSQIEGDYYNTDNEYVVKVYHRRPGERYDRLIALWRLYSNQ